MNKVEHFIDNFDRDAVQVQNVAALANNLSRLATAIRIIDEEVIQPVKMYVLQRKARRAGLHMLMKQVMIQRMQSSTRSVSSIMDTANVNKMNMEDIISRTLALQELVKDTTAEGGVRRGGNRKRPRGNARACKFGARCFSLFPAPAGKSKYICKRQHPAPGAPPQKIARLAPGNDNNDD